MRLHSHRVITLDDAIQALPDHQVRLTADTPGQHARRAAMRARAPFEQVRVARTDAATSHHASTNAYSAEISTMSRMRMFKQSSQA
ncbi:hypothetical protein AAV94_02020 [Lampropedia cohaerens]|uniref:Uncharacterized protein n=1 Tax=Lampropedia cohaerens TaxID=1610491 RepID=A0A0U1Q343_9BURK|nr:hypothetical protein AAV94_02020 [Lampropedia cohaerens]